MRKILRQTVILSAIFIFAGCATTNPKPQPKVIIKSVKTQKYILKNDKTVRHAVALLIKKVEKNTKDIKMLKSIKPKIVKVYKNTEGKPIKNTKYDKIILDFVNKKAK